MLEGAATPGDLAVDLGVIAELQLLPGWSEDRVLPVRERLRQAAVSVRAPLAPLGPAARRAAAARIARALVWRRVSARYT